ncbi:DAK2 domain-containing protein [Rhodococcus hoagii]|uniref:DAK2 domain-containing protein n=1 Tax=Rhodococcus hoagii TaxID=43767 RepID=UPI0009C0F8A8|nr:DAK2 domain-containing protein [Prescottella equi]MBU4613691.1 DAK2 domain-containing protein [Rhodococcus sp. GG48]MBM4475101.1 DAK2 domain-containing protein [Prescottella equi]MBM4476842.1 DAK2 domain-containing protein [Prescottella equi]MBM4476843.1 DAK2 domain-containing protein [Prescottella equi]MBM4727374.1 DAK2 domain-containing protein [Prescottella equi]
MLEVLEAVDGSALYRWADACVTGIEKRCDEINDLNVFPVPDADTGTNLLATMRAAVRAAAPLSADGRGADASAVARALARGAVTGARGNSGAILSQVLRGVAESTKSDRLDADTFRSALRHASDLALEAVSVPMEGTIVTVLAAAADAVAAEAAGAPLARLSAVAADAAAEALLRTPSQLAVLGAAGVVDAGGRGLVVILDALVEVICGVPPAREAFLAPAGEGAATGAEHMCGPAHLVHEVAGQDYEVMYLVAESDEARIADLRGRLCSLGDSVVIVGDGSDEMPTWSVHVHCSDAGAAVEAGLEAGRLHSVRITCFVLDAARADVPDPATPRAVLSVVEGPGAAELFEQEGARVLRSDGAVTPEQLLAAIRGTGRREVVVLPNGALPAQDLIAVGARARADARDVVFLPSSSMVQALAALAVHDAERLAVDDAFAMSEAAAATRWGSLRVAEERALTYVGTCEPGDGLGLVGHEVVVIERDVVAAGCRLVDLVLGAGGELVTVLLGAQASEGLGERVADYITSRHPGVEVMVYRGGQSRDLLQFGVE